jgi:reversibly glycosylated polypeptide/UDP-arabinopyranose mutase
MLADCIGPLRLTETRVMPRGQYFPFCGMNFAFKKEATPMCLFALMGQGSPFGRFDDIWFGVICKKICDHLNYFITCGKPYIYHSKASDAFNNLVKEAPGIKFNENFWQTVDDIVLKGTTSVDCMKEIGDALEKQDEEYLKKLGKAIQIWANLFATP